jgi:hypothetical protein
MKKIKEYKMSLMEKEGVSVADGKHIYVVKCSGHLKLDELFDKDIEADEEYDEFVLDSAVLIFEELQAKNQGREVESVGLWVIFEDGEEIDNSIDIEVLNDIKKYGAEDIEPLKEFFKMTVKA